MYMLIFKLTLQLTHKYKKIIRTRLEDYSRHTQVKTFYDNTMKCHLKKSMKSLKVNLKREIGHLYHSCNIL